ncbi:MAG TPA: heavy-metal-associated domain-containing protein [Patescibacteria group bacterium]|nr:heavy-metal-associated domain-containing protein [Patescibacteria group bacterium]
MKTAKFKITGMHCVSCSMNIDGELEDLPGVQKSETSYAKQETRVEFNSTLVSEVDIKKIISGLGYGVSGE